MLLLILYKCEGNTVAVTVTVLRAIMGRRRLQWGAKVRREPRQEPLRSLQEAQCWTCDVWYQGWYLGGSIATPAPGGSVRRLTPASTGCAWYGGAAAPAQVVALPGVRAAAAGPGRSGLL